MLGVAVAAPVGAQSCGANPEAQPRGDRWDPVRSVIQAAIDSRATASVSVAVAHGGRIIWEEGFGYAHLEQRIPASPDTPYSLASLSKPFTATGLMALVEQGKIDLDRPVNDYLGTAKLQGLAGDAAGATVRRVLSHTAGLPAYYRFHYEGTAAAPPMDTTVARYGIIVTPPGSNYEYSNLGYGILGYVIERVSGRSYGKYMRDTVFAPLGLLDTYVAGDVPVAGAAVRYGAGQEPIPPYETGHPAASEIWSSARDVVSFGMFHLKHRFTHQERILTDAGIDLMSRSHTPDSLEVGYGLGWITIPDDNGYPVLAHAGGMPGVASVLVLFPTADLAIAVLANGEGFVPGQLIGQIAGIVLPGYAMTREARESNEEPAAAEPANLPGPELVGDWTGTIRTYSGSVAVAVTIRPDADVHVTLGEEPPTVLSGVEFGGGTLTGIFDGRIPTADARGFPRVLLRLHLRGDVLNGVARAQDVEPLLVGGLPSYVELRKVAR